MKLIVISSPQTHIDNLRYEHRIIHSLFEAGLENFQVYKPFLSEQEIQRYIKQISSTYQNKVFIHQRFLKFHSIEELEFCKEKYNYAFLSPLFDSISKDGYKSTYDFSLLEKKSELLKNRNIIALGGIDEDKIEIANKLGFAGVAVLGAIWKNENPVEKFKQLLKICNLFSQEKKQYA